MIRAASVAVACLLLGAPEQSPPRAFGVVVRTSSGLPVYEIDCGRFEVRLGGEPRPVLRCGAAPPLNIALILDVSGSVRYDLRPRRLVEEILSRLRNVDRLAVGWFGPDIELPESLTRDARALQAAADQAEQVARRAEGPSPVWDALSAATSRMSEEPGRNVLFAISDARAVGNQSPFALRALEIFRSGVEIHAFGVPEPFVADALSPIRQRLRMIALASGGTATSWRSNSGTLLASLRGVLDELQRGYLLEIATRPDDTGVQRLDVRITTPGFVVRAPDRIAFRER